MKLPSPFLQKHAGIDLQLAPLVDCALLLLIYFLWTANSGTSELSLPVQVRMPLSGAGDQGSRSPSTDEDFDPVVIGVRQQGDDLAWIVQDAPVASLAELQKQLQTVSQIKADVPVIIDPASEVHWEDVLRVFDVARRSGLSEIRFAARGAVP